MSLVLPAPTRAQPHYNIRTTAVGPGEVGVHDSPSLQNWPGPRRRSVQFHQLGQDRQRERDLETDGTHAALAAVAGTTWSKEVGTGARHMFTRKAVTRRFALRNGMIN